MVEPIGKFIARKMAENENGDQKDGKDCKRKVP